MIVPEIAQILPTKQEISDGPAAGRARCNLSFEGRGGFPRNANRRPAASDRHLRLIDHPPPARLAVQINAFTGRGAPHGRTRRFDLDEEYVLGELLEHAVRLEMGVRR
jgi:hypothetical protein